MVYIICEVMTHLFISQSSWIHLLSLVTIRNRDWRRILHEHVFVRLVLVWFFFCLASFLVVNISNADVQGLGNCQWNEKYCWESVLEVCHQTGCTQILHSTRMKIESEYFNFYWCSILHKVTIFPLKYLVGVLRPTLHTNRSLNLLWNLAAVQKRRKKRLRKWGSSYSRRSSHFRQTS